MHCNYGIQASQSTNVRRAVELELPIVQRYRVTYPTLDKQLWFITPYHQVTVHRQRRVQTDVI
jgi:hypothetical protein